MKTKVRNPFIKSSIVICLFVALTAQAQINLTLTPANGTCVSDCQITATATGTTGTVTYAILSDPSGAVIPMPQSSNIFQNLAPGLYTIGVYDATTGGTPVSKSVTVTTSYVDLLANQPDVSYDQINYCNNNGKLTISVNGGKPPFRYKITNKTTNTPTEVTGITARSYTFNSLTPGDYIFEVEDACNQWVQSIPGTDTAINPNSQDLSSTIFSSLAWLSTNSYVESVTNGVCSQLTFRIYFSDIKIYLNSTNNTLPISNTSYSQVKIRVEYPANSGIHSDWDNIYSTASLTINNFDRTQNGDKFRIQLQHPCDANTVISSPVYTIGSPIFRATSEDNTNSYCSADLNIGFNSYTARTDTIAMRYRDGCNTYSIVLKDAANNTVASGTTPTSGNGYTQVTFTNASTSITYKAEITGSNGFSQTIDNISLTINYDSRIWRSGMYDNHSGGGPAPDPMARSLNFRDCDFATTGFTILINKHIPNSPIKITIKAASGTSAITRDTITIIPSTLSLFYRLWTDIPWGTYNVEYNLGCTTVTFPITFTKPVDAFTVESLTVDNNIVCGSNDLVGDAYFSLNGVRKSKDNEAYRYWILILDGPEKIGTRANGHSLGGANRARISNLAPGTYKVLFYPYDVYTSTQIVNGKTVTYYPITMHPCYEERTVVIPEYVRPIINIPLSGGITCASTGSTNLNVNILQGSKPPFLYRYKVKGASDNTYFPANFQTGNVFSNLSTGVYTVQVKDDCGSITTQDITIFDGTQQFVGIIGEVLPGVVCETREVILSVLSIGPVSSYQWEYRKDSSESWSTLPSTSATYVIPSAAQKDKGQYRVTIYNNICYLSSAIEIIDVLPPAETPTITTPNNVICLGGNTLLTAHTTIASPNYQWYKNGQPVGTNASTYSATTAGSYTVVVTPSLECPSDTSLPCIITEQIPAHPDPTDVWASSVCNGGHPVIHVENSLAGVTYNVFTGISNSTNVGSAVGNGSDIDITLSTTPTSSITYYVGATLNSCNSASRTSVTVTVVSTPSKPTVTPVPSMCLGSATTFSITVSNPTGASYYFKVYDVATGGVAIGESSFGVGTISGIPIPASSTSYFVTTAVSEGCESARTSVAITIKPSATESNITVNDTAICYGTAATLTASSSITNTTYKWYASQIANLPFHTGASYTTSNLTTDSTFYISISGDNYCENDTGSRKAVTVTVNPVCAEDDIVFTSCDNMPFTINVLANDNIHCTPVVSIVSKPNHITATIDGNNNIEYTTTLSGLDTIVYRVTCGNDSSEAKVYITVSGSAFVDDVWYFGSNTTAGARSPGIRFVKDENGQYIAQNASGESWVSTSENSLVVSSPYCNGQTIFYSSHSQLYNSLHDTMQNGAFTGSSSIADGLAACYMGNNKYLFFTITKEYNVNPNERALLAYIIDMNANNGKGARGNAISIEADTGALSESLELVAKAGTTDQYWLIYAWNTGIPNGLLSNALRVRSVDVSDPNDPKIGTTPIDYAKTSTDYSSTLKVSPQNNKIALTHMNTGALDIFDFNSATGTLSNLRTVTTVYYSSGVEFSPDGNQIYAASWTGNYGIVQYNLLSETPVQVGVAISYGTNNGGGLKLGPDGKIYVTRAGTNNLGIISTPNDTNTTLTNRYSYTPGFPLGITYYSLQFSAGLTKPSVMACNMNNAPITQADSTAFCVSTSSRTTTVNVLLNDEDIDGDTVYLTNADFVNASDTALAGITVSDSNIILTVKPTANIPAAGYLFEIIYDVKDNGLPASQCATGILKIQVYKAATANEITVNDTTICYNATATLTLNAPTMTNPDYKWYTSQTATVPVHSGATHVLSNLTADTVFYFSVSDDNYCENDTGERKAVTVTVYPELSGGAIGASQTHCYGITPYILMGVNPATGGTGNGYNYVWESSTDNIAWSPIGVTTQGYTYNSALTQTTLYRRTVTNLCGTKYSDTLQITVLPLPVVSAVSTNICVGTSTLLSPTTDGTWTSNDATIVSINNNNTAVGVSSGTATLTFTSSISQCSETVDITVREFPDVDEITGEKTVCIGSAIQLSNVTSGGIWESNNGNVNLSNPNTNSVTVTGVSEGTTYITYTVSNGVCQTKITYLLKITTNIPPEIIIGFER